MRGGPGGERRRVGRRQREGARGRGASAVARSELPAVGDDHGLAGFARLGAHRLSLLHDVHALGHGAEDDVLAVEPGGLHRAEEELRSVRVGARVRHGEDAGARVLEREVLVRELAAIDGLTARAVASSEVAALAHEVWDDAVEGAALEVQGLARLARALLPGAEAAEVLRGLRGHVGPELHDDPAGALSANRHVEEHLGVGHRGERGGSTRARKI
mmetsp:Transcript_88547/g.234201  ORF Transcript_88547/g.234201 Transcript_88547/m.234201 type:complete len:216 (-) Transcript_88547:29-676(-)